MYNITFTPNKINVSFRGIFSNERESLKDAHCALPISVGQKYHEEEKLLATIEQINKTFGKCTVLLADSLQRYNTLFFYPHLSEEQAVRMHVQNGNSWLERNQHILDRFSLPFEIIKWDHWLQHKSYPSIRNMFEACYNRSCSLQNAFSASIHEFIQRFTTKHKLEKMEEARYRKLCLEYLKEECSILPLWAREAYSFLVYPSPINEAIRMSLKELVFPHCPNVLKPISLRFKKNSPKSLSINCQ